MQLTEFNVDQGTIKRGSTRRDLSKEEEDPVLRLFSNREGRQQNLGNQLINCFSEIFCYFFCLSDWTHAPDGFLCCV